MEKIAKIPIFQNKTPFFAIRGCFSQMFVLQKRFIFARGLNWDQSCLWKTPPSHFLLFSPLACPYFFNFFHLQIFGELRKLHAKIYTFSVKIDREINFQSWLLFYRIFHPCHQLCHSAMMHTMPLNFPNCRAGNGLILHICIIFTIFLCLSWLPVL